MQIPPPWKTTKALPLKCTELDTPYCKQGKGTKTVRLRDHSSSFINMARHSMLSALMIRTMRWWKAICSAGSCHSVTIGIGGSYVHSSVNKRSKHLSNDKIAVVACCAVNKSKLWLHSIYPPGPFNMQHFLQSVYCALPKIYSWVSIFL